MPSTTSARRDEARASAGKTAAGRRFANKPSSLRTRSRPFSGRRSTGMASQAGPPTAPSSTARHRFASASVASESGVPSASIAAPPIRPVSKPTSRPKRSATVSRTRCAWPVTSGPMPSPGSTRTRSIARSDPPRLVSRVASLVPLELVDRIHVRARAGHQDVGVRAVADHAAARLRDRDRHLALRVHAAGNRLHLVLHELALGVAELGDGAEHRIHRAVALRGGLLRLAVHPDLDGRARHHEGAALHDQVAEPEAPFLARHGVRDDRLEVFVVDALLPVREVLEAPERLLELRVGELVAELREAIPEGVAAGVLAQ